MAITRTFEKLKVQTTTVDGNENVIKIVIWRFTFTDGTYTSKGDGKTVFDANDLSSFISIDQVTDDMLEQWVINTSFSSGWDDYVNYHETVIANKHMSKSLTTYYVSDDYDENMFG